MPQYFFFGDLVNGVSYSVFLPFYYFKAVTEIPHSAHPEGLIFVCLVSTAVALSAFYSWHYSSVNASWLSYLATVISFYGIGLYHFPHGDEAMLLVQFFWHLFICTANMPHTLSAKIRMGLISALGTVSLSYWSSLYTVHENVPYIVGGAVAYIALRVGLSATLKKHSIDLEPVKSAYTKINFRERKGELAALFVLACMFLYFIVSEAYKMMTQTGYNVTGGYRIVRAAVFGATGFVATGVFRKSSDDLVRRRAVQTGDLNMARFALDKSETAIAFIDQKQTIIWCNTSFVRLTSTVGDAKLVDLTLDQALRPSKEVRSS